MTTQDALLCSILTSSQDDTPRLVYADWLEENGEPERAEFIRVQVGLANLSKKDISGSPVNPTHRIIDSRKSELRRRERELRTDENKAKWYPVTYFNRLSAQDSRGFIDSITLSWSDWLLHEAALYWSREQTVECRCMLHNPASMQRKTCVLCKDGRINRPFVPTAQPLSVVRLTTSGRQVTWTEWHTQTDHFYCEIGTSLLRFDRVKCATCDGNSSRPSGWDERPICPQCQGRPLNSWTCEERWAGLAFEMPEVR